MMLSKLTLPHVDAASKRRPPRPADSTQAASHSESQAAPALSDEAIVERVLAGDVAAFELLMRRNNARVFRTVRSIVRSADEAEDVMQDAYVRAFEHLRTYEKRSSFSTWLIRIAVHEALARVRRAQRVTTLDDADQVLSMPSNAVAPEQHSSDRELRELLERALARLPEEFRLVFVLRAVEQMSVADVAEALNIPVQTVKTRFFRARQRLRHVLLERFDATTANLFEFHLDRCDRVVASVLTRLSNLER